MKAIHNFEVLNDNSDIRNNLKFVDVIYVKYKKTNSKGIILYIIERNIFSDMYYKETPLLKMFKYLPIYDRNGQKIRKRQFVEAIESDFTIINNFDTSDINKDWICNSWTEEGMSEFNLSQKNR